MKRALSASGSLLTGWRRTRTPSRPWRTVWKRRGLIERAIDRRDKRNLILTLTDRGEELLESLSPLEEKVNETIETILTPKQTELCKELLLQLERNL